MRLIIQTSSTLMAITHDKVLASPPELYRYQMNSGN
ncbi:hypothetical protein EPYR_00943 [Erwinia pyrifoliae DSM 12163]|nr:hypothetical protein EPYR_00943 [Erwinia pyrifoliae DSM 12163]